MYNFLGVTGQNFVYYKNVALDLAQTGLTVIKGKNFNVTRGTKNTNAAGKSLIVSALPLVLFNAPISGDDTEVSVKYERDSDLFSVTRHHKGLRFNLNGADVTPRLKAEQSALLSEWFPLSEEEFYTLWYLDSRRPSLLQFGRPAARLEFFTNLFQLHDYDIIRGLVNTEIGVLNKKAVQRDTLASELSRMEQQLPDLDVDTAVRKYRLGKKKLQSAHNQLTHINAQLDGAATLEKVRELEQKLGGTRKELRAYRRQKQREKRSVEDQLVALSAFEQYLAKRKAYDSKVRNLLARQQELEGIVPKTDSKEYSVPELEKRSRLLRRFQQGQKSLVSRISELNKELGALLPVTDRGESSTRAPAAIEQDMLLVRSSVTALRKSLDHLRGHVSGGQCEFCLSELDPKTVARLSRATEADIRNNRKKYSALAQELADAKKQQKDEATRAQRGALVQQIEDLEQELAEVKKKAKPYRFSAQQLELALLTQRLDDMDKPTWDSEEPKEGESELRARLQRIQSWLLDYGVYDSLVADVESEIDSEALEEDRRALSEQINALHKSLPLLRASIIEHRKLSKQIKQLSTQIDALNKDLKDLPAYKLLHSAYSNSGLKILAVQNLTARIAQQMNQYASILFPEPIEFHFDVQGSTRFDILATRKVGRKVRCSDVKALSGAESRAFTLLLMLAVQQFVPNSRRMSFLVLDEMSSNMDPVRWELFVTEFLPLLKSVIPHVIVVTPDTEAYPHADRILYAVKRGSVSKLVGASEYSTL